MKATLAIFMLVLSFKLTAGTWGVGALQNDSAIDWLNGLKEENIIDTLNRTIDKHFESRYLDSDVCSKVIVAAEIASFLKVGNASKFPPRYPKWLSKIEGKVEPVFLAKVHSSVVACSDKNVSELAQMWNEDSERSKFIANLLSRLN